MAEAVVSVVLEKLFLNGLKQDVRLVVGVKKEIESLTQTLAIIQGVLQDADEKQVNNKAVKVWLEEIKDISYDVEDILDEWSARPRISHVEQSDPVIKKKVLSKLFNLLSCSCSIRSSYQEESTVQIVQSPHHEIGIKIKELNERLVEVNESIQMYGLKEIPTNEQHQHRPITCDLVMVEDIYGRDVDKDLILTKLLDESAHKSHVPVISIVGAGGFGKTTLAQLILHQTKQLSKFDKHMWVCVFDPFNLETVAKKIIEQAQGEVPDTIGWPMLQKSLYESVRGKRFILVLDDVWSYNSRDWRQLKQALYGGAEGSRILITTRDESVANMMDSSYTKWLGQLSNDDCWSLFKHIAFSQREDDLSMFEDIGKAISDMCNGVPIAARVIASLMRFKRTRQEWRDVLGSNIWEVQEGLEGFLPSILLSYYALPSYLKPCLMYCAVLPEDAKIKKKKMVELWMAHGYLGSDGSADLERIGRAYFDYLAKVSFFQDFQIGRNGNITSCKMNNLMRNLVQFLTKSEISIMQEERLLTLKVRHLYAQDLDWSSTYKLSQLRTLILVGSLNCTSTLEFLHELKLLRVLSLRRCGVKELPSAVGRLMLLRYLDLSKNLELEIISETVCSLINLQTLNLKGCKSLRRLPEGIRKLSNLRHLEIGGCEFRPHDSHRGLHCFPPEGLSSKLEVFPVGVIDAQKNEEGCMIGELTLLSHLEGHFKIKRFGHVTDIGNAAQVELKMKENLLSLVLEVGCKQEKQEKMVRMDGFLEALQPHENLKKLEIKYYHGIKLPSWISFLSKLTVLTLMDFHECLQLPALGKLESLEFLHLRRLLSVTSLGCEFYGVDDPLNKQVIFPKLKILKLHALPALEELDLAFQNGVDFFPNLRELIIRDFFPNLRKLRIGWLPGLQKLPDLGKLFSLETLELSRMVGLKHSFHEFIGIPMTTSDDTSGGEREFPALTNLCLLGMTEWEEEGQDCDNNGINIMPHLSELSIYDCPKLKVIPFYMFSHALRELTIQICPQLTGFQPRLPPLLKKLKLGGDVGELSWSLYPLLNDNHNNYPNLIYFEISDSSQSSLPQGFNLLRSIRRLVFHNCEFLDFMPNELMHLNMLEELEVRSCPNLAGRFSKGDISSSSQQELTEIEESSSSDLEKSSQPNVNVHSGIFCHNCKMYPIVGKRYKCQDCYVEHTGGFDLCENCYNTFSKHPDLANQHHTQGHTFEHIANCGDNSGPLHSNDNPEDAEGGLGFVKLSEIEELDKA